MHKFHGLMLFQIAFSIIALFLTTMLFSCLILPKQKEKRRYGTFSSLEDIHPDSLVAMANLEDAIKRGEWGCTMCPLFLNKQMGKFDNCPKCGFPYSPEQKKEYYGDVK